MALNLKILGLERTAETNILTAIDYELSLSHAGETATRVGRVDIQYAEPDQVTDFIPFEELTIEDLVKWVFLWEDFTMTSRILMQECVLKSQPEPVTGFPSPDFVTEIVVDRDPNIVRNEQEDAELMRRLQEAQQET